MVFPSLASASRFAGDQGSLASLDRTGLENCFHGWRGASGRLYVCSVYPVGAPLYFDCRRAVVAAARKGAAATHMLFLFQPGPGDESDDFRLWTRRAKNRGADQWHVHLLAATAAERDFAELDLAVNLASRLGLA